MTPHTDNPIADLAAAVAAIAVGILVVRLVLFEFAAHAVAAVLRKSRRRR